ncbi:MAG: cation transporter [Ruminococcaceae bacterium]|nr:cation transporter [Oscillospiraceae bacterium]
MNNHSHHHHHSHSSQKNIGTAFFLNLLFVFVELAGGYLTGSFAILSDAIHDFGDCATIGLAWILEKISHKKADEKYTYGYKRYSLISGLMTSAVLVAGSVGVIIGSVMNFFEIREINGIGMLLISVFGVAINGFAAHKTSHGNGAGEKAINLHLLEDVLGWLAVFVGSIFVYFLNWCFIDSLLSLIIAAFILWNAVKNVIDVLCVMLEKTPVGFSVEEYRKALTAVEGVVDVHHIHIWSLDGEKNLATVHITPEKSIEIPHLNDIKKEVIDVSKKRGIEHITIEFDFAEGEDSGNCGI